MVLARVLLRSVTQRAILSVIEVVAGAGGIQQQVGGSGQQKIRVGFRGSVFQASFWAETYSRAPPEDRLLVGKVRAIDVFQL